MSNAARDLAAGFQGPAATGDVLRTAVSPKDSLARRNQQRPDILAERYRFARKARLKAIKIDEDNGRLERQISVGKSPTKDMAPRQNLQPLQEWEGYVTSISKEIFSARLIDITAGGRIEEEQVDLPLEELSAQSLSLLTEGAIFRWVIGYQRDVSGTKMRVSNIVFRRLPAWTKSDLSSARAKSIALREGINWD